MFRFHKLNFTIIFLLVFGLLVRLALANLGTLQLDYGTFVAWSDNLARNGFTNFYQGWSDYLPGYLYILWLLGKIRLLTGWNSVILYKLPAILADLATGFLVYTIVRGARSQKWGLLAAGIYIFNPAILANSTFWGQVDSLTAFFALLAVWLVGINPPLSAAALAIGTLVKPQAAFAALVILYLMLTKKWKVWEIFKYGAVGASTFLAGFLPFAGGTTLVNFVLSRVGATLGQYPYTSINAFNLWAIGGMWQKDVGGTISPQVIGFLAALAVTGFAIYRRGKEKLSEYRLLTVVFLTAFLCLTRIHERHLLPALAPLTITAGLSPLFLAPLTLLSLTYLANLRYAYVWITQGFHPIFSPIVIDLLVVVNFACLIVVLWGASKKVKLPGLSVLKFKVKNFVLPPPVVKKNQVKYLLLLVLAFSLLGRLLFLDSPPQEYFDEVYHAFTARTMLDGDPKAWEWWNSPPKGFAYEWTHPPLAKLAMWGSMVVLGENAFAWRLPQAILGTAVVFLIFKIAKELLEDEWGAVLSAGVFALDGLPLVMSRIGMNDTYFLFFALACLYLFLTEKYLFASISLGLAAASKWTSLYLIPILVVAFLALRRKVKLSLLWFLILPAGIYLASYIPMFLTGHTWDNFVEVQKQMWWYHTNLKATHAYSSPAFSWPLMLRPIWLYTSGEVRGFIANIYAMGNPAVFWFGLAAVILTGVDAVRYRNKKLGLVVFAYLAFFLPWVASPRIMFLYHYLPALPFLAMAAGYTLRKNQKLLLPFFLAAAILFVFFYPHYTGIKIPVGLDRAYYWFSSWR